MAGKLLLLSCWCVTFTINVAEQRYVREEVRGGVIFLYALVYDMALCCNTVRNVALRLKLVGHPCTIQTLVFLFLHNLPKHVRRSFGAGFHTLFFSFCVAEELVLDLVGL